MDTEIIPTAPKIDAVKSKIAFAQFVNFTEKVYFQSSIRDIFQNAIELSKRSRKVTFQKMVRFQWLPEEDALSLWNLVADDSSSILALANTIHDTLISRDYESDGLAVILEIWLNLLKIRSFETASPSDNMYNKLRRVLRQHLPYERMVRNYPKESQQLLKYKDTIHEFYRSAFIFGLLLVMDPNFPESFILGLNEVVNPWWSITENGFKVICFTFGGILRGRRFCCAGGGGHANPNLGTKANYLRSIFRKAEEFLIDLKNKVEEPLPDVPDEDEPEKDEETYEALKTMFSFNLSISIDQLPMTNTELNSWLSILIGQKVESEVSVVVTEAETGALVGNNNNGKKAKTKSRFLVSLPGDNNNLSSVKSTITKL